MQAHFTAIVNEHKGLIYKVAGAYCTDAEDRKDLVQEILLQLWRAFPRYDPQFKRSTWMYRIALNTAISFYRKDHRRRAAMAPLPDEILVLEAEHPPPREAALEQLHQFISALPDGYDTDVRKRGGRLSAGQRQLVAFARAFLADPAVLILDEATSSLDVPSERAVQRALRTVLASRTALIIAHRLSTVEIADRVLVLEHGRVIEDGSPEQLVASGAGEFADLHRAWVDSLA